MHLNVEQKGKVNCGVENLIKRFVIKIPKESFAFGLLGNCIYK